MGSDGGLVKYGTTLVLSWIRFHDIAKIQKYKRQNTEANAEKYASTKIHL